MRKLLNIFAMTAISLLLFSCTKTVKTYYPNGQLESIIHYKGKKESGKTVYFYNKPNTVEMEIDMKNGKRNGEFRRYFINGLLDTYCVYENDLIEGVEVMYLANGSKSQETTYLHGKKNGPHKAYHIGGSLKVEGAFLDDKFDGDWTYYDERGVVVGEGHFDKGAGKISYYTPNGNLERVTQYVDNKKDGVETYYSNSGQPYKEIVYKQDRIVETKVDSTLIK